jgi:hypothetical protein
MNKVNGEDEIFTLTHTREGKKIHRYIIHTGREFSKVNVKIASRMIVGDATTSR